MKDYKYFFILIAIALFSQTQLLAQNEKTTTKKAVKSTLVSMGQKAPDFTVEMLDGSKIKLSDLKGKVVLLNFWATWCPPCMKEFQEIPEEIIHRFKNEKDFVLLPISRQEKRKTVKKKMKALQSVGIDFPVGIDPQREIYSLYATQQIPRNFIIDKNGNIVYLSIGYSPAGFKKVVKEIEKLLK